MSAAPWPSALRPFGGGQNGRIADGCRARRYLLPSASTHASGLAPFSGIDQPGVGSLALPLQNKMAPRLPGAQFKRGCQMEERIIPRSAGSSVGFVKTALS